MVSALKVSSCTYRAGSLALGRQLREIVTWEIRVVTPISLVIMGVESASFSSLLFLSLCKLRLFRFPFYGSFALSIIVAAGLYLYLCATEVEKQTRGTLSRFAGSIKTGGRGRKERKSNFAEYFYCPGNTGWSHYAFHPFYCSRLFMVWYKKVSKMFCNTVQPVWFYRKKQSSFGSLVARYEVQLSKLTPHPKIRSTTK